MIDGPRIAAASGTTKSLVILLHGYGANGDDLFGLAHPLSGVLPDTAFAAPNAPEPCLNNPYGFQWFPIPWLDGSDPIAMATSFARSVDILNRFIDAERDRYGLSDAQVALVGFSQGTMMSLHVAPRRAARLAGVVGFSGRLASADGLAETPQRPPVLLVHGDADQMIPVRDMFAARDALTAAGFAVAAHVAPGVGHGIDQLGLTLAARFLVEKLR